MLSALGNLSRARSGGDHPLPLTQTSFFSKFGKPEAFEMIGVRIGCP
jgi:hypothetical protein